MRLLAFDPGERYVGYVVMYGWEVLRVDTLDPDQAIELFWAGIENGQYDAVVGEQWRNYSSTVTWSECETVEVLGAVKYMCRRHRVPFYKQPALIKRPGRARMRAHGVVEPPLDHIPVKLRVHASDASIHAAWWLFEHEVPIPQVVNRPA